MKNNRLRSLGRKQSNSSHRLALQVEQLEDRILLAADPFTVSNTELVTSRQQQSIIDFGDVWKYLDNGTNQGTAWRGLGFNDSAWNQGPGQLGYGDGDEATVVSFGNNASNKFVTTYFRNEFNIADASKIHSLDLSLIRDDGAAVYLNGVEVWRDGLNPNAAFNDLATQGISGNAESTPILNSIVVDQLPAGTLRNGSNVWAVEVHQRQLTSSDISFDMSVTGVVTGISLIADFSADFDLASVQASDLTVNGTLSATSLEIVDSNTLAFGLPALPTGIHSASIASGAIVDSQQNAIEPFTRSFTIAESQYAMKYNPRIQLGNAPLAGFSGSDFDQIELLWQTVTIGSGTQDQFLVDYRLANNGTWSSVSNLSQVDMGEGQRVNHSAAISGLMFDADYDYRVRHVSGSVTVASFETTFRTRLQAGDASSFSFVAYGDSAYLENNNNFRVVQTRINQVDPDFALLLGDNVYQDGTVTEFDARFDPLLSPEAAEWTSNHLDFASFGNHDINSNAGLATELNYALPIPVAGVNAPAAPSGERPEHNYSFDYGDAHFVTFDSNSLGDPVRLQNLLTYLEADLAASTAKWKIVFAHHPAANVPNDWTQSDNYFEQVVPRLKAAGVDLLLAGHGHSYSWTYPLQGYANGQPTFVADTDRSYAKGDGLVQVIAGTGGKSISPGSFDAFPFVASGFSATTNPAAEYGFAKLDVSADRITVSYIAADDGAVIDSFSINDGPVALPETVTFQQGVAGYNATVDTYLAGKSPTTNRSSATVLNVDGSSGGHPVHSLLRFADLFGSGQNQIPLNAEIQSAELTLQLVDNGNTMQLHRMLQSWNDTDTWNSFAAGGGGIQAGVEASASIDASGLGQIDVLASLQYWQNNPTSNFGWALLPTGTNGVDFYSAEGLTPPKLVVKFLPSSADAVYQVQLPEESLNGALVATVNANELGLSGPNIVYSIIGGDPDQGFAIDASGNITISNSSALNLDFDDGNDAVAILRVQASNATATAVAEYTVKVTAVNDNPPNAGADFTAFIVEQSANGTAVGTIDVSDSDLPGDTLTFAIVSGDPNQGFAIDATGQITILNASVLDLEFDDGTDLVAVLTVQVSDGIHTDSVNVTVRVTPDNPNTMSTVSFQQGVAGYTSTRDTQLRGASPTKNYAGATSLNVDSRDSGEPVQVLLRFDNIFGSGAGQIPSDAEIQSAVLTLNITNTGHSFELYQMLQAWSDNDTWNSFTAGGGGIQPGVEAASIASATAPGANSGLVSIDITAVLQAWIANPAINFGLAILPTGSNGVDFDSSEGTIAPRLVVEFLTSSSSALTAQTSAAALSQPTVETTSEFLQFTSQSQREAKRQAREARKLKRIERRNARTERRLLRAERRAERKAARLLKRQQSTSILRFSDDTAANGDEQTPATLAVDLQNPLTSDLSF
jgi:molybdopterin-binding protein